MRQSHSVKLLRPSIDGSWQEQRVPLSYIHPASNGINNPWYVHVDDVGYGYFKNCAATDPAMEQLEVWLAFLGNRLGMKMAETWLVLDENDLKLGCFSLNVATPDASFSTADEIKNRWLLTLNPIPDWAIDAVKIYMTAPKVEPLPDHRLSIVTDITDLKKLLRFVYNVLSLDGQYYLTSGFVDMVLFDCLVGQKDRNMHGFGLVCNQNHAVEMSSLFDNASIFLPGLDDSMVGFCNIFCEPAMLAQAVSAQFPQQAQDFIQRMSRFCREEQSEFLRRQQTFLPSFYHEYITQRLKNWHVFLATNRS